MKTPSLSKAAFSLVEVALAIAITSFCLIALLALLPVGMKSNQASIEQTAANGILSEITADLRATPPTIPPGAAAASQQFSIPIPANPVTSVPTPTVLFFTSDGQSSTTVTSQSTYRLTVTFLTNGVTSAVPPKTATFAQLQATWPATVSASNAIGSVQTFVALDRN